MSEIRGYTLGQFEAFSRAAARQYRQRLRDEAAAMRAAQYEKKEFLAFLRSLESDGN